MSEVLQFVVLGLGKGAVYATLALALVIVFRATGMLNFAQGEMAMFSTFITWMLWDNGLNIWVALAVSMVVSFLMGAGIERFLIRPASNTAQGPLAAVIVTIGLLLVFNGLAPVLWGTDAKPFPQMFGNGSLELFGARVDYQALGTLVVLAVEAVLLWVLFQRTRSGLALRAVSSNAESAGLVGVPVGRMLMLAWGLAAAVGAVAGAMAAYVGLDNSLMAVPLIYAFAAATLGGFDSPVGAVVGGLIVGVVSELAAQYIPFVGQDLRLLPAFLLILVVLLVRPQGLFGRARVVRV